MKITLPKKVAFIIEQLEQNGFPAYAVGGCVRDSLLGQTPADWDITTSANPQEIKGVFPRTVDTGIAHGTVTVLLEGESFEVTTYRIDGQYEDGRHPKAVVFVDQLAEDLRRRDFTINAMAYHMHHGLVDLFGGRKDLTEGIIRCVGNPKERFTEDALRMMRAVRFSAQLGFVIEPETKAAISHCVEQLSKISKERISTELVKLLISPHPEEMQTLYETGISKLLFPWFDVMMETEQRNNRYHCYTVGGHSLAAVKHISAKPHLRLTMLLHDVGKPNCRTVDNEGRDHFRGHPEISAVMAKEILRGLKMDNDTVDTVSTLVLWHDDEPPLTPAAVRRAIHRIGERHFPDLFLVKRADNAGKSDYGQKEKLAYIENYERLYEEIIAKNQCLNLKDLAVSGADLIAMGMKPGKEIGETLEYLLEQVLEHPEENEKERLLGMLP
ncbi:polynucleotide adenylyltransferase [Clostridia bacterium]|nr:polynucleotide adenylyltransferase [Clostridia bacterium]